MTVVLVIAVVWLAVAIPAALAIGRAIAHADHQQEQEVRRPHLTLVA